MSSESVKSQQAAGVDLMHDMARYISEHADRKLSLPMLAKQAQMSSGHFQKSFKAALGLTPKAYQQSCRIRKLKRELGDGASVTEAIYAAGYGSGSRVYEGVDQSLGMTPSAYRKGGAGEMISYAAAETSLGVAMIAATKRGICFLQFADDRFADGRFADHSTQLLQQLKAEYPAAKVSEMPPILQEQYQAWIASLNAYLDGKAAALNLPLDIRGTAFQKLVWDYLQKIPAGELQSYTEVAQAIGKPKAVRAVASACAKNRVAICVPCHRVIRGDGNLAGYRWGLSRKRTLIDLERGVSLDE